MWKRILPLCSRLWGPLPLHGIGNRNRPRARDRRARRASEISNPAKHIVSARLAFLAYRAFYGRLNHKVHQLFFDIHDLFRFPALQPLRDLPASQPFNLLPSRVGSYIQFGP